MKFHLQDEIRTGRPVDNFFTHLTKNIIEHKRCKIRF